MKYRLVDSGNQKKLEQFGSVSVVRPSSVALWEPSLQETEWQGADAHFSRDEEKGWQGNLPPLWIVEHEGVKFKLTPTEFGHLGIFPEHSLLWKWGADKVRKRGGGSILNLFAYSGGATIAFAKAGASVCHVDASMGMVQWAKENAKLNQVEDKPIRWIVDDAIKFLQREVRRGRTYDGILLDPPSFGRGAKGEVFKIERDLRKLLDLSIQLLSPTPLFVICSTHTTGITPLVLKHMLEEWILSPVEAMEMVLPSERGKDLPSGVFARWSPS